MSEEESDAVWLRGLGLDLGLRLEQQILSAWRNNKDLQPLNPGLLSPLLIKENEKVVQAFIVEGLPELVVRGICAKLQQVAAQAAQVAHAAAAQAAAQTGAAAGLGPGSAAGAGAVAGLGLGSAAGAGERFTSREQVLREFRIQQKFRLAPNVSKQSGGNYPDPDTVSPWAGFAPMAQRRLDGLSACPMDFYHQLPMMPSELESESQVSSALDSHLFTPFSRLGRSCSPGFDLVTTSNNVIGLAGRPDWMMVRRDNSAKQASHPRQLYVPIELKCSSVFYLPDGDLVTAYKNSPPNSHLRSAVNQAYDYTRFTDFGILMTDKQLFCIKREGPKCLISTGISLFEEASLLTAAAAMYCMLLLSEAAFRGKQQHRDVASQARRNSLLGLVASVGAGLASAFFRFLPGQPPQDLCTSERSYQFDELFEGCGAGGDFPRILGTGNFQVLEGRVAGRAAAVKLADLSKQPHAEALFRHEAEVYQRLAALQGICVPRLLAYGHLDGGQYFLATSLEGASLDSKQVRAMPYEAVVRSTMHALDQIHEHGVLHGDLALRNVVLAAAGDKALLLDFGISEVLSGPQAEVAAIGEPHVAKEQERQQLLAELCELHGAGGGPGVPPCSSGAASWPVAAIAPRFSGGLHVRQQGHARPHMHSLPQVRTCMKRGVRLQQRPAGYGIR